MVDYKTNRLGDPDRPVTAADYGRTQLAAAMLHSDYPLQALLYSVVLHRFLRWRQPDYTPDRHFGGVLYLFVRGMCGPDTPIGRRASRRGVQLATAGAPWCRHCPTCSTAGRAAHDVTAPEVAPIDDPADRRLALGADGLLRVFNEAGVLEAADVHVAARLAVLSSTAGQPPTRRSRWRWR